jgi:hypothetical protein
MSGVVAAVFDALTSILRRSVGPARRWRAPRPVAAIRRTTPYPRLLSSGVVFRDESRSCESEMFVGKDRRREPMTTIHAGELRPGDIVDYHGQRHRVTHIDRNGGWAFSVAFDDAGWAIALGETDLLVVDRPA